MKKISSLFKRDYDGDRLVYDEVVPGNEWVLRGLGTVTVKLDGTACMYQNGIWYKRYDRKRIKKSGKYKAVPADWVACQEAPDEHSGHWPGWVPVDAESAADKWHREAISRFTHTPQDGGTYELVGPKVQSNPYKLAEHELQRHGDEVVIGAFMTLDFAGIRAYLCLTVIEGLVWHHPDGRLCKIKRRDFGFVWPPVNDVGDDDGKH